MLYTKKQVSDDDNHQKGPDDLLPILVAVIAPLSMLEDAFQEKVSVFLQGLETLMEASRT